MKRIKLLTLVFAMCLSLLAGCSNGGKDDAATESTPDAAASEDAASTTAGAPEEDDDSSETSGGDTIKVGILAPKTGSSAQYGLAVRNGAAMFFDQLNKDGGINGKQVEYIEYDEEGDPAKAVTGYNSLVDQGVTAIIGDVTTIPTLAVVPEAFADNMPLITASATSAEVTYDEASGTLYTNVFRSCFIDPFQGEKMAKFASEILEAKTAAVLYNIDDDYSVGVQEAFAATAEELGLDIVASETFSTDAVDFQGQLTNIGAKEPDILFVPVYYSDIALIAEQARGAGMEMPMLGVDGWDTVLNVVNDPEVVEGSYYSSGYSAEEDTPEINKFLEEYRAEYDEEPSMFAAQGYDAAMILSEALKAAEDEALEAGSDDYKQAVIDAMKETDIQCVTGNITYDEYNNPEKEAAIINIKDGEPKFWGKF